MQFELDPRLRKDSVILGEIEGGILLLMKNAYYPWFVIVPETMETELYRLKPDQQQTLLRQTNQLSEFIQRSFSVDKLNIAAIGNVVSQLHIHIIGRRHNDPCWPNVVWGNPAFKAYSPAELEDISRQVQLGLADTLTPVSTA